MAGPLVKSAEDISTDHFQPNLYVIQDVTDRILRKPENKLDPIDDIGRGYENILQVMRASGEALGRIEKTINLSEIGLAIQRAATVWDTATQDIEAFQLLFSKIRNMKTTLDLFASNSPNIEREVDLLWHSAAEEDFEMGMDNMYSLKLSAWLTSHGVPGLEGLKTFLFQHLDRPRLVGESLVVMSRVGGSIDRSMTLESVSAFLNTSEAEIREWSARALEVLGDPQAIKALELRVGHEEDRFALRVMKGALKGLKSRL